ncbi:MAG: PAS domain-containing sensor histidine kinase [Bacteroidetes bacterium]|nr:PAS domain-containing sensor histidine kinase [Bacteroidota bacterium]
MDPNHYPYELFFELSPDLLCIAGFDGYFKKINPAVSKLLGYSMEELYAKPINYFIYEDDKAATAIYRSELIKSSHLYNFENRYLTKSGEIVWLAWTSYPVDSDKLVFAIAKNITHKKQMEAERNDMLSNLTTVNAGLKQLTYTTSHDLRSPVNNLLSIINLLDLSKVSDPETTELIQYIKLAGDKLKHTLNNYVDELTKGHNDKVSLEEVDVKESLDTVLQSISALVQTSKVSISSDFSKLEKVSFNKAYLESVFLNLITNSIKYARPGFLPVISISTNIEDGIKRLTFADNGLGFDLDKVKDKIFGLHQKFHDHSDSKGIGLYLVYNHVTNLMGQIKVESKINEGTKFVISFKD